MTEMTFDKMVQKVEDRVIDLIAKFEDSFKNNTKYNIDIPDVVFKKKGTTAGMAYFDYNTGKAELDFNPVIMKDNWNDFDQTVIHEVCHYLTSVLYGTIKTRGGRRSHHGDEWQRMMRFFGASPDRCHHYDTSNAQTRKQRRWRYTCSCMTHHVSTRVHNSIRQGKNSYKCRHCSTKLVPVNKGIQVKK